MGLQTARFALINDRVASGISQIVRPRLILLKGQVTHNRPNFLFPKDEGRHVDALYEWWYFNAHLETNTGRQYGLFVTFHSLSSHKAMRVVLVDKSRKLVVKRFITKTPVKASTSCLDLQTGNNWWRQVSERPFRYTMHVREDDLSLSLELLSRKPPLFANRSGNHSGNIKFGLLGYSRYYSLTNIKVSGTLQLGENRFEVRGVGWIDRQWGNWDFRGIGGWDWFSIQLSNNVEILAGQIFHPVTGGPMGTALNLIDDEGGTKVYDGLRIKRLGTWRSPRTGLVYATGWEVSLPPDTNLFVSSVLDDQEIYRGFWEGCCEVKGRLNEQPVNGVGYVEQAFFSHPSQLVRLISLGTGAIHHVEQLVLRRGDFKVWKLQPNELLNRLSEMRKKKESGLTLKKS